MSLNLRQFHRLWSKRFLSIAAEIATGVSPLIDKMISFDDGNP